MPHPTRATVTAALAITLALPGAASADGPRQDLRNPDQRVSAQPPASHQDLRNPDNRTPVPVAVAPKVRIVEVPAGGFDWGDAGIGAAGGLALISLTGGIALLTTQRRRSPGPAASR
jgi:hypothetical protein